MSAPGLYFGKGGRATSDPDHVLMWDQGLGLRRSYVLTPTIFAPFLVSLCVLARGGWRPGIDRFLPNIALTFRAPHPPPRPRVAAFQRKDAEDELAELRKAVSDLESRSDDDRLIGQLQRRLTATKVRAAC